MTIGHRLDRVVIEVYLGNEMTTSFSDSQDIKKEMFGHLWINDLELLKVFKYIKRF